jgi:hypothetical protein
MESSLTLTYVIGKTHLAGYLGEVESYVSLNNELKRKSLPTRTINQHSG